MNTEELQKLIDAAEPEDRLSIVQSYMLENKLVFKMRQVGTGEVLPRHIVGLGTSTVTIQSSADRVQRDQKIRLAYSPLPGGPYSLSGYEVKGNSSLAQPVVAQISGLAPDTTYYFVVQVVGKNGAIVNQSEEATFTTLSHKPFVNPAEDIRMTTAEISGSAQHLGALETIQLWYAEGDGDFKAIRSDRTKLTGLIPNTSYSYFVQIVDQSGIVLDESSVRSFKTLDYVAKCAVGEIFVTSAELKAMADFVPSSQQISISYKKTAKGSEWQRSTFVAGNNTRNQEVVVRAKELEHSTSYVAKAQVVQGGKVLYESSDVRFKTGDFILSIVPENVLAATADITGTAKFVEPGYSLKLSVANYVSSDDGRSLERQSVIIEAENLFPDFEHTAKLEVLKGEDVIEFFELPFKTEPHSPEVTEAVNIKDRTATLVGSADFVQRNGHARFAWAKENGHYGSFSPLMFGDTSKGQRFAYMAFGLQPDTEYRFILQLIGTDGVTITDQSEELFFKTAQVKRRKA